MSLPLHTRDDVHLMNSCRSVGVNLDQLQRTNNFCSIFV